MSKAHVVERRWIGLLIGAAAILFIVGLPKHAFAQASDGTLTHVEYYYNSGTPQLLLQQNGNQSNNYFAQTTAVYGCSVNVDIDTIKIWVSIAQAAQLSGKSTTIYYSVCNGTNYINDVLISD